MKATQIECSYCGEPLDGEEAESPRLDLADNKPMCDDCYHDHYEFTCCCCENYGETEDQHNLLVVFEPVSSMGGPSRELKPGIYEIKGGPYHGGCLIGGSWLYADKLKRIADVNPDMDGSEYPCGHLCLECQKKVLAQFAGKCSLCKKESASCLKVRLGSWKDFKANKYQWTRPKVVCAACRHSHKGAWELAAARD